MSAISSRVAPLACTNKGGVIVLLHLAGQTFLQGWLVFLGLPFSSAGLSPLSVDALQGKWLNIRNNWQ